MTPTIGRILIFKLNEEYANQINRRRTTRESIAERISFGTWPIGAQAHMGNPVEAGQEFPMLVTAVWPNDTHGVNGKVLLDGTDELWVTSVSEGDGHGQWHWPVKE